MRRLLLALAAVTALAGCTAQGEESFDPFAYTKKPLYASSFDLAKAGPNGTSENFWIEDGSIGRMQAHVWVNATAGSATVRILDASGAVVLETSETTVGSFGLNLGKWEVQVVGSEDAAGRVDVRVGRA